MGNTDSFDKRIRKVDEKAVRIKLSKSDNVFMLENRLSILKRKIGGGG